MKHPVRIVLKKERTDVNGQLMQAEYKTIDIDSEVIESLLCNRATTMYGSFKVVGAEALNEEKLEANYRKKMFGEDDDIPL